MSYVDALNEAEKKLARDGKPIDAMKLYRARVSHQPMTVAYRLVDAYRDGFRDGLRFKK